MIAARIRRVRVAGQIALFAVALMACSLASPPTPSPTSRPSAPPALHVGPVADWDGAVVNKVCLDLQGPYVGRAERRSKVEGWIRAILEPVGVVLAEPSDECDADLTASIEITPKSADYSSGVFFTGGDFDVTVTLRDDARRALVYHDDHSVQPPMVIQDDRPTTADEYIDGYDFYVAGHLLQGATRLWGNGVAAQALLSLPTDWPQLGISEDELMPAGILNAAAAGQGPEMPAAGLFSEPDPLETYLAWRTWFENQPAVAARPTATRATKSAPVELGQTAVTPDGWSIRVDKVESRNGTTGSERDVVVYVTAVWNGFGAVDFEHGSIGFFRSSDDRAVSCASPDPELRSSFDFSGSYEGTEIEGWAGCFEVPAKAVKGLAMIYEPVSTSVYARNEGADDLVWFALR